MAKRIIVLNMRDPFRWQNEGEKNLEALVASESMVSHEVLYEDDITHIKDAAMRVGEPIPAIRFKVFFVGLLVLLLVLLLRAASIQIFSYEKYAALADRNRFREVVLPARRGLIRDRNDLIIAENPPSLDVHVIPRLLPVDQSEKEELLVRLGRQIGMSVHDMDEIIDEVEDPDEAVLLRRDVPYNEALSVHILAAQHAGIDVVIGHKRKYSFSNELESLSHILGYIGIINPEEFEDKRKDGYRRIDSLGKTGIESSYESALRGEPGVRVFEVDSRHLITATIEERLPVDGADVVLTLDLELQREAENALKRVLQAEGLTRGTAIALNPQDGSILAIV